MMKIISVEGQLWEKLNSKSYEYGFDSLTIFKSIGLQLYGMWFPEFMENKNIGNWIEWCKVVEEYYDYKKSFIKDDFSFSLVLKEVGIDIKLESSKLTYDRLGGMEESLQQMVNYLIDNSWEESIHEFMPLSQKKLREQINNTYLNIKTKCLHEQFYENSLVNPGDIALIWFESGIKKVMTYKELKDYSLKVANMLIYYGVKEGDLVSVVLPKGIEQVIAVLGIYSAGAAYVPINIQQPIERKKKIINTGNIKFILTNEDEKVNLCEIEDVKIIGIEDKNKFGILQSPILMPVDSTAYVIFTSGTTGLPKGVVISHKSAYNTIIDINKKFKITKEDCAIAISELDFDLSVYDIFGLLSAGGRLLVLNENDKKEAIVWNDLIIKNNVTVWNTVPALFDMLLTVSELENNILPIKKVFLSGDWIKIDLFSRGNKITENCEFISLGGATEASIWSNYYKVDVVKDSWKSIPYGIPLSNQMLRVVDKLGRDCPDYVRGELWLGGSGVAKGYLNQEKLTEEKFLTKDNVSWYKTGDMARYNQDGIIEFLGRSDTQIKLNGFRIELGEIENIVRKYSGIKESITTVVEDINAKHLATVIVPYLHGERTKDKNKEVILEPNKSLGNNELYERIEIVERFLVKILIVDNLITKKCCNKMKNVFKIWISWLEERNVINLDGNKILPGKRYQEVLNNEKVEKTELGKSLFRHIKMFEKILIGEEDVRIVLEHEDLLPESLSMQGLGTQYYLDKIINKIKEEQESINRPVNIAILGARTGLVAEKILKIFGNKVSIGLFDTSSGMLDVARKRFSGYKGKIDFEVISEGFISNKYLYSYDLVVSVNNLHQYKDPLDGVLIASILLKNDGSLLAIEYEKLDPVAIAISALLENGFSEFIIGRSRKNNPLLTRKEWMKVFSNSNFKDIKIKVLDDFSAEYIDAKIDKQQNILQDKEFNNYLKKQLPYYMIPEKTEILPWIPLNKNGKIDRKKIAQITDVNTLKENKQSNYIGKEKEIADIWKELFKCKYIGRDESFFEIGGDSLLATRFIAKVKQIYNIEFSLRDMFSNPKLYQVAEIINCKTEDIGLMVEGEL